MVLLSDRLFGGDTSGTTLVDVIRDNVVGMGFVDVESDVLLRGYPNDMVEFIEQVLGDELWEVQREIVRSVEVNPTTTVKSCHGSGKSFLAARLTLAFLHCHRNSIVLTLAPSHSQVRNVMWRNIRGAAKNSYRPLLGKPLTLEYNIGPEWYALGMTGDAKNETRMQGYHADSILIIVDEAAGVDDTILRATNALLTGSNARLLFIGNPTSQVGIFRDSFEKDQHLYHGITISAFDTPNFTEFGITKEDVLDGTWREKQGDEPLPYPKLTSPAYVEREYKMFGADSVYCQTRVDAKFADSSENMIIPLSYIEKCEATMGIQRGIDPVIAGLDVARLGSDESVMVVRQGRVELGTFTWRQLETMETVGKVRTILDYYGGLDVEIRVDMIGIGSGVADRLKELGYKVVEYYNSASSSDPKKWPNLRHEGWWQIRELFRQGKIVPAKTRYHGGIESPGIDGVFDDELKAQLVSTKFSFSSNYTMPFIEPKDKYKARTGRSPDRADALMMAFVTMPQSKVASDRPIPAVSSAKRRLY